jgi:hypothetical protein
MSTLPRLASFVFCLLVLFDSALRGTANSATVPADIEASANQELALTLTARGVQIYKRQPMRGESMKFEWVFQAPEAELFDVQGRKVGRHFAGPTWELTDGGKVIGRVKAKVDAPDGKGIPWLLLDAVEVNGPIMGKVRSIQRIDTVGGRAPADSADASKVGQEKRVQYTATYKFYVEKL